MDRKWPDGATHFDPATGLFYRRRAEDDWEFFVNCAQGWCDSSDWQGRKNPPDRVLTRAPIAESWTGQDGSLPPVGLIVEVFDDFEPHESYSKHVGQRVRIVAHDHLTGGDDEGTGVAVYAYNGSGGDGYHALIASKFRPIRTAEQLAAEERKGAVAEMASRFALFDKPEIDWLALFDQIYRAGYRKQEQSK